MNTTKKTRSAYRFDAYEVSLELIGELKGIVGRVKVRDGDLARQMRRAASSVALNLREGLRRAGGDRLHCWRIAAGSVDEVVAALEVAVAWE
jgi:four helix bundle protein